MLHSLACAAIAYCLAIYLNSRWPNTATAIWSGPASAIVGLILGSALVVGGLSLAGVNLDAGQTLNKMFGETLILTAAGAAAGVYLGRKKGVTGAHDGISSIPMRTWVGGSALTMVLVILVAGLIWQAIATALSVGVPAAVQSAKPRTPATTNANSSQINWNDFTPVDENGVPSKPAQPKQGVNWHDFTPAQESDASSKQYKSTDRDGKPCSEITEFLGECTRKPQ